MTPKEKAEELYIKCYALMESPYEKHKRTKECALIAVDEILIYFAWEKSAMKFWKEVKEEIEKL